jgi:hypothetical protein
MKSPSITDDLKATLRLLRRQHGHAAFNAAVKEVQSRRRGAKARPDTSIPVEHRVLWRAVHDLLELPGRNRFNKKPHSVRSACDSLCKDGFDAAKEGQRLLGYQINVTDPRFVRPITDAETLRGLYYPIRKRMNLYLRIRERPGKHDPLIRHEVNGKLVKIRPSDE